MTPDQLRTFLDEEKLIYEEKELPHGIQFRCNGAEIFVVYNKGKLVSQGTVTELTKRVKALEDRYIEPFLLSGAASPCFAGGRQV